MLMPEEVPSPMDLNPTIEVSAAIIADCVMHADRYRLATAGPAVIPVIDEALRQVAFGAGARRLRRDPA